VRVCECFASGIRARDFISFWTFKCNSSNLYFLNFQVAGFMSLCLYIHEQVDGDGSKYKDGGKSRDEGRKDRCRT
jgi:hypothetical protein